VLEGRHLAPVVAAGTCALGLVVVGWLALDVPAAGGGGKVAVFLV
jgi:hypothetical protein